MNELYFLLSTVLNYELALTFKSCEYLGELSRVSFQSQSTLKCVILVSLMWFSQVDAYECGTDGVQFNLVNPVHSKNLQNWIHPLLVSYRGIL